ncbi:MAG TPA: hypothetical protein VF507_03650, partial [Pyrinomonadaceae bacterium]
LSFGLVGILRNLQQKDPETATRFAGDVVKKLQTEDLTVNHAAAFIATDLLRWATLPPSETRAASLGPNAAPKVKPLALDDGTIRDLAGTIANAALQPAVNGPGLIMQLQPLLPEIEKRVPERAAQLRRRLEEVNKKLDPRAKAWMQFEPLMQGGSTEALLDAAAKAPPEMRQSLYSVAAWKLLQAGDAERARQVVTDNLGGQERDALLMQIDTVALAKNIKEGKLDEAKQFVSRIRQKDARARALAQLALGIVEAKGDRKVAAQMLEEARGLVARTPDNEKEMNAFLEVARAYAVVEPARTFEMLDPLVEQANEMLAAAALLEKFGQGRGVFRKGEMLLIPGLSVIRGPLAQYEKQLAVLARVDFERTKALADRFNRSEARIMARLVIAQSLLSDRVGAEGRGVENGLSFSSEAPGIIIDE